MGVAPNLFYRWQKELFDHADAAFEVQGRGHGAHGVCVKLERKVEALQAKLAHKDSIIAEIAEDYARLKNTWRGLKDAWIEPDVRDEVVDFVTARKTKTEIGQQRLVGWLGIARSSNIQFP